VALSSLVREGAIRRVQRGLYDKPKVSPTLGGKLSPDIEEAARAIARRLRWKIVPDGPWAANLLALSTQVPAKIVYLTDGPSKKVQIGKRTIQFKHARPQALAGPQSSALIVQALRHLGKDGVGDAEVRKLRKVLSAADRRRVPPPLPVSQGVDQDRVVPRHRHDLLPTRAALAFSAARTLNRPDEQIVCLEGTLDAAAQGVNNLEQTTLPSATSSRSLATIGR
jgi:Family of unknown function (DUF6088)